MNRRAMLNNAGKRGMEIATTMMKEGLSDVEIMTSLITGLLTVHAVRGVSFERIQEQVSFAIEAARLNEKEN